MATRTETELDQSFESAYSSDTMDLVIDLEEPNIIPGETRVASYSVPTTKLRSQDRTINVAYRVTSLTATSMRSPKYVAATRRKSTQRIIRKLASLEFSDQLPEVAVATSPIVTEIRQLLDELDGVKTEGNTRECLRIIRETFLNGGWNQYRKPGNRKILHDLLTVLANEDEISPEHAERAFAEFEEAGIETVALPAWEQQLADAQE